MGEIAEMMLDGTLCQFCGVAMVHGPDDHAAGFPVSCGCHLDTPFRPRKNRGPKTHRCQICRKKYRGEEGLAQHMRVKHMETSS